MTTETPTQVDPIQAAVDAILPPVADPVPDGPKHYVTRDEVLQADDLTREDVYCPEWGGWFIIRAMTGVERGLWDDMLIANKDEVAEGAEAQSNTENFHARLVALTAINPDGSRMFAPDDRRFLGDKNAVPLIRCYAVAARLSKLRRVDIVEATDKMGKGKSGSSGTV